MEIEKLSISLPGPQVEWIEELIESGAYGNRSEYLRELIRRDQRQREIQALRAKLLKAKASLDSGKGSEGTEALEMRLPPCVRTSIQSRASD